MNNKRLVIGLAIACAVLAVVSVALAVALYNSREARFVPTKSPNPYLMFDNKTAQACWSGPAPTKNVLDDLFQKNKTPEPLDNLPLCKDLK